MNHSKHKNLKFVSFGCNYLHHTHIVAYFADLKIETLNPGQLELYLMTFDVFYYIFDIDNTFFLKILDFSYKIVALFFVILEQTLNSTIT